ncbi:MAG: hypothetical protein RLZZ320_811 [Actinomycetota bacterium]
MFAGTFKRGSFSTLPSRGQCENYLKDQCLNLGVEIGHHMLDACVLLKTIAR